MTEQFLKREEAPERCTCGDWPKRIEVQLPNFVLKGGGWYRDGYSKSSSPKKETKTE